MNIYKISVASNGFIIEDERGGLHVAKTLAEAALLAGETPPVGNATSYAPGFFASDLLTVREYFKEGRKIDAIKLLRDCFEPRLGIREAKELVENLCS